MTKIQEYSEVEAALGELRQKYGSVVYDVRSPVGMSDARRARAHLRDTRVGLEKRRKEIKEPAIRLCQLIDSEARQITDRILELETPIDEQIQVEEKRKEDEKLAILRAEEERRRQAEEARHEAERQKLAAERAEIERQRAELERQQRERERLEREARERIEVEQRAARIHIEEQERKARLERENAEREARAKAEAEEREKQRLREVEEAQLRAERQRLDDERRKIEDAERFVRMAKEEAERITRLAEQKLKLAIETKQAKKRSAHIILREFKERFGHLQEFQSIVNAINEYFKDHTNE